MSDWRNRGDRALGLSFAGYSSSMAIGVAVITLDEDSGEIQITKFWAAIHAGSL